MMLIPGRSSKQGTSLNKGKLKEEYLEVTSTLEMNKDPQSALYRKQERVRPLLKYVNYPRNLRGQAWTLTTDVSYRLVTRNFQPSSTAAPISVARRDSRPG